MKLKHRRLTFVLLGLLLLAGAAALILNAARDTLVFFYSPSDLATRDLPTSRPIRLGGLVEEGSLKRGDDGVVRFVVTDLESTVPVVYRGLLPDLFREGQGVVAQGTLGPDGVFIATEVLAKHDENYMPPEVAEAIKKSGQWKPGEAAEGAGQ